MDKKLDDTYRAAIIIASDRSFRKQYDDLSGPVIQKWLKERGYHSAAPHIIPDDKESIWESIRSVLGNIDFIVISGGTGLGPHDVTPQTLQDWCDYEVVGIGELLRRESEKHSANTWLSRCGAWVKDQKLILALPGSPRAVIEQLQILESLIPRALDSLKGQCKHERNHYDSIS